MYDLTKLPTYPNDELENKNLHALIELMINDEDRVPRNVIDECARRGEKMVDELSCLSEDSLDWIDVSSGEW